jgi:crossover junction endodeoxyribonuclease RusA
MTSLTIPFPPSANRLWRNVGAKTLKSAEYRAWLESARWAVKAQRPEAVGGPYSLAMVASRPDNRRRDLGNLLKATEDLLVAIGVIEDDHLAQSIYMTWSATKPAKPATISLTVLPWSLARQEGFA